MTTTKTTQASPMDELAHVRDTLIVTYNTQMVDRKVMGEALDILDKLIAERDAEAAGDKYENDEYERLRQESTTPAVDDAGLVECVARAIQHGLENGEEYPGLAKAAIAAMNAALPTARQGVDEELLGRIAEELREVIIAHINSGAMPLRTSICKALRPYLRTPPQANAASVLGVDSGLGLNQPGAKEFIAGYQAGQAATSAKVDVGAAVGKISDFLQRLLIEGEIDCNSVTVGEMTDEIELILRNSGQAASGVGELVEAAKRFRQAAVNLYNNPDALPSSHPKCGFSTATEEFEGELDELDESLAKADSGAP